LQHFSDAICPMCERKKGEKMEELIPIVLFITTGLVFSLHVIARHRERQLLIEKEVDVEALKKLYHRPKNLYNTAKWALMLLFGGVGLMVGEILDDGIGRHSDGYAFASVAISIGIGLLVWQKLYGNKEIEESNK